MSVTFQCGGTGSGKTYRTIEQHLIPELVEGRRVIVTNIDLRLPELAEYLQREYPEADIDLHRRLVMIEDEDLTEFFRFRPFGYVVPKLTKEEEKEGKRLDFQHCKREDKTLDLSHADIGKEWWDLEKTLLPPEVISSKALPGVLYLLDEVHIPFSAQEWQRHGTQILFYLTQRRKFGAFADKVVCMTQYPEQVAKSIRLHCHDWRYTTNHSKIGAAFGFKRPELLTEMRYLEIKTSRSTPVLIAKFKVDPNGIGNVYWTDGGVGIKGGQGKADTDDKVKGLPWWTLGIPAAAVVAFLFFLPNMFRSGVTAMATSVEVTPKETVVAPAAATPTKAQQPMGVPEHQDPQLEKVTVLGWQSEGSRTRAWLSDGRNVDLVRPFFQGMTEQGIVYDGEFLPFEKPQKLREPEPVVQRPVDLRPVQVIANPGAPSGPKRIRIAGFDGRPWAVRSVGGRSFEGDHIGGVGETFVSPDEAVDQPQEEHAASGG